MWYCFIVGDVVREYWVFYLEDRDSGRILNKSGGIDLNHRGLARAVPPTWVQGRGTGIPLEEMEFDINMNLVNE